MTTIKNQNFGVEIELTGITRQHGAEVISAHFGGTAVGHLNDGYDSWSAKDTKGRTWKCMRDVSIKPQIKSFGRIQDRHEGRTSGDLRCEVVTPILQYDDIEDLQEIIRELRAAGAMANESCGIHVHVDGANHDASSLTRLMMLFVSRQDLIYKSLEIGDRANRWCHPMSKDLFKAMKGSDRTRTEIERIWYSSANDGYHGGVDHSHYNATRYHGVNLHAFFTKGTVEFRLFNGTTHAGKIKAYIQFCLAMSAWAIRAKDTFWFTKVTDEHKAMEDLMVRRLKLSGKEFETARTHLLRAFEITEERTVETA